MLYKLFISIPGEKAAIIEDSVFLRSLIYKMLSQSLNLTKLQRRLIDGLLLCDTSSSGLLWMCARDGMCWTRNIAKAEVHSMGGKGEVYTSLCVFVGLLTAHNFCHLFMTARSGIGELKEISNTHTQTHVDLAK